MNGQDSVMLVVNMATIFHIEVSERYFGCVFSALLVPMIIHLVFACTL
jgi:hypothetical protein